MFVWELKRWYTGTPASVPNFLQNSCTEMNFSLLALFHSVWFSDLGVDCQQCVGDGLTSRLNPRVFAGVENDRTNSWPYGNM